MATVVNDIVPGQSPNPNGSPVQPGTLLTGPIFSGTVVNSDGTGTLAGLGSSIGTQNVGYACMAQSAVVTQASGGCAITIPAQSQITDIYMMVTTVWSGAATTFNVGATAGTNAAVAFTAVNAVTAATARGQITITPGTGVSQIANWNNVSNATFQTAGAQDVQLLITSANTGTGVGTLTVFYVQGINLAS